MTRAAEGEDRSEDARAGHPPAQELTGPTSGTPVDAPVRLRDRLRLPGRGNREIALVLQPDDIVPDSALVEGDVDRFDHEAIAGRIAELACGARPPVNIALFGPWGSGKSSIYSLMRDRINTCQPDAKVVRYDAWKYGGQSLKRHFISSIADELGIDDPTYASGLNENHERYTLSLGGWLRTNWKSLGLGALLALAVATLWLIITASVAFYTADGLPFMDAINDKVTGAGTVLGLILAAAIVGPKALESATVKVTQAAPGSDDEFAKRFSELVTKVRGRNRDRRLVVFIDELDRCAPADVVATLVDLKTFLDQPGCIFVVAADRDVLETALQVVPQAKPVRESEPYYSTPGAFLDKIFQHQIALPPLRSTALTKFARTLVIEQQGLWGELRGQGSGTRLFDDVIYTLVPAHVRSPRRVKVLLNNYATQCRVAQARGINWVDRATEIAALTVLQTEFPSFAGDLLQHPRLIAQLLEADGSAAGEATKVLDRYAVAKQPDTSSAGPAGVLLTDDGDDDEAVNRADQRLNRELDAYLRKTAAANIPTPRIDLLYLQSAGGGEGLEDPRLGSVIDYASDTDPRAVIQAFEGRKPEEIRVAARLLAERSDAEFGPGRVNLIQSACGLVEHLDHEEVRQIAAVLAPSTLVVVRNGDLRHDMIPGALIASALASNDQLVDGLLAALSSQEAQVSPDVFARSARALPLLDGQHAGRLETRLIGDYVEQPDLVHDALLHLPGEYAQRLWFAAEATIRQVLLDAVSSTATPEPQPPTSPRLPRPAGAATPQPAPVEPPGQSATARYTALLDALDDRSDPSPTLLSKALLLGQSLDADSIYDIARNRSEDLLAHVTDPGIINEHALLGIASGPPRDWAYWADRINADTPVADGMAGKALGALIRGIAKAPLVNAKTIPAIADAVLRTLPDDGGDHRRLDLMFDSNEDLIAHVLTVIGWDDDSATTRRFLAYEAAQRIGRLLGPRLDQVVSDDILTAVRDVLRDDDSFELARQAVSRIPHGAAVLLDQALETYD